MHDKRPRKASDADKPVCKQCTECWLSSWLFSKNVPPVYQVFSWVCLKMLYCDILNIDLETFVFSPLASYSQKLIVLL